MTDNALAEFSGGSTGAIAPMSSAASFGEAVRMAKFLCTSALIPESFRNKPENIVIAIDMAARLNMGLFPVMQSLYIVHGKPSFSAAFLIATLNASKRFTTLQYRIEGAGDARSCVAWANDRATGERVEGPAVSIAMAKAEGWESKNGSKWKTMPELMLRYRAATFFVRTVAPEISLGMLTSDEIDDIGDVTAGGGLSAAAQDNFGVRRLPKEPIEGQATTVVGGDVVDTGTGEVLGPAQGAQEGAQAQQQAASTEGQAAAPQAGDGGAALTSGMTSALNRGLQAAKLTREQVEAAGAFGKPITRDNLNQALDWIKANGA